MTRERIYQMEPVFDEEEVMEVAECVRSSWVTEAKRTADFEAEIAAYVGMPYAVAVPSCTVGLAMSLMACDIGPGDEVIVPDLTFVATANAINLVGATPVLVDICPENLGLDPTALEKAVTPRTRAVIPVWFNGRAPAIEAIVSLAKFKNLVVIEDAACALGSRLKEQHAGTFGDFGCFSFNTTKIITTGMGGIIVTRDPTLFEKVERLKNHGRLNRTDYHPMIGFNFGFSDLLAALGLAQMRKLQERVQWKNALCRWYYQNLANIEAINMLPLEGGACLWYPDIFVKDPVALKTFLEAQQIQTRLYFPPVHTQPCYRIVGEFSVAETTSARGLWLPAASYLTESDVEYICQAILDWIETN